MLSKAVNEVLGSVLIIILHKTRCFVTVVMLCTTRRARECPEARSVGTRRVALESARRTLSDAKLEAEAKQATLCLITTGGRLDTQSSVRRELIRRVQKMSNQ